MTEQRIKDLLASDIYRRIEEVIKVDQTDEQVIREEIAEYVVTDAIRRHYTGILERYYETPNKPHEGIAIWVSGFFGSGKSSFSKMLGLAELEITLEAEGRLDLFQEAYTRLFQKDWDAEKGKVAIALNEASRVMHVLDPNTFPMADSWIKAAKARADISAGGLADRCKELVGRRRPGRNLVFVIDEVGQFVARDVQKMLDLQGVVQSLGRVGRGKIWIVVTSQERLTELVGGLDDRRVELARMMDRFPLQVHLEPSDISEVTSKRVLSKNAGAQKRLRALFEENRGRLTDHTRLTADIKLPALTAESFVELYPLLPYQIDLIIQVVSGLRTQGGVSKHVGGANRTIIKLAQQLLINPAVNLAEESIGRLVRIDQIYDLVEGNIDSEVRGKIAAIAREVDHPLAQPVAKAICLLQYVKSVHRSAENLAAALHPAVAADSQLSAVNEALAALVKAHKVRLGDDGYRIPSPAEDDWEAQRARPVPKPGEISRLHSEILDQLWQPQPGHNFMGVKVFKAGLHLNGKVLAEGDIPVQLQLVQAGKELKERVSEARSRSQTEDKSLFWVAARVQKKDLELLMSSENLHGLTPVFTELSLVRDEKGKPVFNTDSGPLAEVLARIENQYGYGMAASGRYLADELGKEPYGWDFDVVRLFVLALLRAGKIDATSKGQIIESALSLEAKNTFGNNNLFRQASFRPKKGLDFEELVKASESFQKTFGKELPTIDQHTRALEEAYEARYQAALSARAHVYTAAWEKLRTTPGWEQLDTDQQERIAAPLASHTASNGTTHLPIPQI